MVSRIGSIPPLLLLVEHFGPIRDTNKSTVAATGIEKSNKTFKVNTIPEFKKVPWTRLVKSVNSLFKNIYVGITVLKCILLS